MSRARSPDYQGVARYRHTAARCEAGPRTCRRNDLEMDRVQWAPCPAQMVSLLVDARLSAIQTVQDLVEIVRLDHELLQTFHGNLCHFGRSVTVKELRDTAR